MTDRILLDTNVVLDVLLNRTPHVRASAQVFDLAVRGEVEGLLCSCTLPTITYIVGRTQGAHAASEDMTSLLRHFEMAPVTGPVLAAARARGGADFEDAVVLESALHARATAIVTRDESGFANAELPVLRPEAYLALRSAR